MKKSWVVGVEFQPPTKELSTTDANWRLSALTDP
jgi:hypothetical protein